MTFRRRRAVLDYYLPPRTLDQIVTDLFLPDSTKTWEQRCEASLRASRRRRGLRSTPESGEPGFRMHKLDFTRGTVTEIDPSTPPRTYRYRAPSASFDEAVLSSMARPIGLFQTLPSRPMEATRTMFDPQANARIAAKLYDTMAKSETHPWRAPEGQEDVDQRSLNILEPLFTAGTFKSATDCPRGQACIDAHECRYCGADRGEPCRSETPS